MLAFHGQNLLVFVQIYLSAKYDRQSINGFDEDEINFVILDVLFVGERWYNSSRQDTVSYILTHNIKINVVAVFHSIVESYGSLP